MNMRRSSNKLEIIQLLRASAAFFVVISHISHELVSLLLERTRNFNEKLFPGDFGVDLFFVISGFIMIYTCWNKFGQPNAMYNFARKRMIRIVPLYWIMTTLMICIVIVLPDNVNSATSQWQQWVSSYLFIPYARETDGLIRPVLGLGWSLEFEIFFYLIFGVCLFFVRRTGLILVLVVLTVIPLATSTNGGIGTAARFYGHPIIWEFAFGIIIGAAYRKNLYLPNFLGFLFALIGIVLLIASPAYSELIDRMRHIHYGIPALLIMAGATLTKYGQQLIIARPFMLVGEISYSIYLCHPFVIGLISMVFHKYAFATEMEPLSLIFVYGSTVCIGTLVAGYLVHFYVDTPASNWVGRIWPIRTQKMTVTEPHR